MPHCSSEREEEQFESMVGGAAGVEEAKSDWIEAEVEEGMTVAPPQQTHHTTEYDIQPYFDAAAAERERRLQEWRAERSARAARAAERRGEERSARAARAAERRGGSGSGSGNMEGIDDIRSDPVYGASTPAYGASPGADRMSLLIRAAEQEVTDPPRHPADPRAAEQEVTDPPRHPADPRTGTKSGIRRTLSLDPHMLSPTPQAPQDASTGMDGRSLTLPNLTHLRMMRHTAPFQKLLNDVKKFNRKIHKKGQEDHDVCEPPGEDYGGIHVCCVVKTEGTPGNCHTEWKTIPEYVNILLNDGNYNLRDDPVKQALQDNLKHSIDQEIGAVLPVDANMHKLNNIYASIVLKSHERTMEIYLQNQKLEPASGSQTPRGLDTESNSMIETMIEIGKQIFNFLHSHIIPNIAGVIDSMLQNIKENSQDYRHFVTRNQSLIGVIFELISKIHIPTNILQKAVKYAVQMGLITHLIELIRYCYDPNISIRSYALAGIVVFIFKCLGVAVRTLTPSENFINKISDEGNVTVNGINDDLQSLGKTSDDLPIQLIIAKLLLLREYYQKDIDKTTEVASRSFIIASINICDSIITLLNGARVGVDQAVRIENIENAKKIGKTLIMFTTGLHFGRPRYTTTGYTLPPPPPPPSLPLPQGVQDAAVQQGVRQAISTLRAQSSGVEEETKASGGGAAKRTTKKRSKKVKTKMLKGKSKKHLKKSKKDKKSKKRKKTGKKRVRFHSNTKKTKKNTRKRR